MGDIKNTPMAMKNLYLGNLPPDVSAESIRQLFNENKLMYNRIIMKNGYAFVECPDQSWADQAIDKLNKFSFNGSSLVVEPSISSEKKKLDQRLYGHPMQGGWW